jgi:hypothetical protein
LILLDGAGSRPQFGSEGSNSNYDKPQYTTSAAMSRSREARLEAVSLNDPETIPYEPMYRRSSATCTRELRVSRAHCKAPVA